MNPIKQNQKPQDANKKKSSNNLKDSLDNTWADPPRIEDTSSAVPPLELRNVETPLEPRERKVKKKKKEKKKSFKWSNYLDPKNDEFFKEGSYTPPKPFMELARNPSDKNIGNWIAYNKKKNALNQRLQLRM